MIRRQKPFVFWLLVVAVLTLVLVSGLVLLLSIRKPAAGPPVNLTLDNAGLPRWHGVPLENTNVRDATFEIMGRLGLKAGVTVTNVTMTGAQASNLFHTMQAMGRAGLLNTNQPPNPYE